MDLVNFMGEVTQQNREQEIDLLELFRVLWGRAWLLILSFVLGCTLALGGTSLFITPQYQSTATIYIFSKSTSITSLADIQIGNQLTVDFQLIATTREVLESVIDELSLNMTYGQLRSKVHVTNPNASHMLQITVTDPNPVLARDLSNTLADHLREQVADIMNTDKPAMVERAVAASVPSSPNVRRNTMIGGLLCLLVTAGILTVIYLMDDTISTEEEVKKYLGLETLAAIPFERGLTKKRGSARRSQPTKKGKLTKNAKPAKKDSKRK